MREQKLRFGFLWRAKNEKRNQNFFDDCGGRFSFCRCTVGAKYRESNAGKKDQSYVLWNIPKELIEHVLFPLADFENKEQIREIARENNLKVANKPDSEDICFVPDGNQF